MRVTNLLGVALLATATLFTACSQPSFEERKAAFQKAIQENPATAENLKSMNKTVLDRYVKMTGETKEEFEQKLSADFKKFANEQNVTLTDEEAILCSKYLNKKYLYAESGLSHEMKDICLDSLSEVAQAFIAELEKGDIKALCKKAQNQNIRNMIDKISNSDQAEIVYTNVAEKLVNDAKKYNITFTVDEAKEILKEHFTKYYESLK